MASKKKTSRAQRPLKRDNFFWIGQMNKASAIINTSLNLLDPALTPGIARGLKAVLDSGNNGGPRAGRVLDFEPLLIAEAGVEATLLHAGRSSQDMHMTATSAQLREEALRLAMQLRATAGAMLDLAKQHRETLVPNYTNGVAAQPNSYSHYLLGHIAGLSRDGDRLREFYARLDLSPMGSTVLNGSYWPLDRDRMSQYLGFAAPVDNAFDAVQIRAAEIPVELGSVCIGIGLHIGTVVQDIMLQYSQPRPWILLREGGDATYASSAMPQKRNPGLLNNTRSEASRVVTLGMGRAISAHNLPSGMIDTRATPDNIAVLSGAAGALESLEKVLKSLVVDPKRALEELDSDWTASQELADVLMREHAVPFRVGHHFASEMVGFARARDIRPSSFPYAEAQRIFKETCEEMGVASGGLPVEERRFREALDPRAVVKNRKTEGGPQEVEVERMIAGAEGRLGELERWVAERTRVIEEAIGRLDADFERLLKG